MKKITLLFTILVSFASFSQNSISLNINHIVGSNPLEFNTEFSIPGGDKVQLDRCEYYVSQISIVHDGGMTTDLEDVWILVDAFDQETYDLGEYDIDAVESITFHVGVETPYNNDDPAAWPNSHPLAPQNPSMHWGWAAGYRFLAMEGLSGASSPEYTFEVHALGNDNYHEQTIEVSANAQNGVVGIGIDADYSLAFADVSTAAGGITHGESGDSVDMLNNFRDNVFSAGEFVGVQDVYADEISFYIAPNPSVDGERSKLILEFGDVNSYMLEITDTTGKLVHKELVDGASTLILPEFNTGVYLINLKLEEGVVRTQRWVVK